MVCMCPDMLVYGDEGDKCRCVGVWVAGGYRCGRVFECESLSLWVCSPGAICIGIWDAKLGRMDGEIV